MLSATLSSSSSSDCEIVRVRTRSGVGVQNLMGLGLTPRTPTHTTPHTPHTTHTTHTLSPKHKRANPPSRRHLQKKQGGGAKRGTSRTCSYKAGSKEGRGTCRDPCVVCASAVVDTGKHTFLAVCRTPRTQTFEIFASVKVNEAHRITSFFCCCCDSQTKFFLSR